MDHRRNDIVIVGRNERRWRRAGERSMYLLLLKKHFRSPITAVMVVVSLLFTVVAFSLFPLGQSVSVPSDIRWFIGGDMPTTGVSFGPWFETWGFTTLLAFLCVALMTSLAARLRAEYTRAVIARSTPRGVVDPARWPAGFVSVLISRRFSVHEEHRGEAATLRASRGGGGILGSILFHGGLLMLGTGIFLGRQASMEGTIALTEGQVFDASTDRFGVVTTGAFYAGDMSDLRFILASVEPAYVSRGATTPAVRIRDLTGAEPGGFQVVHVNRSSSVAGFTVHLGTKTGYAPYIRVENDAGGVLHDGFTRLAALGGGSSTRHRDLIRLEKGVSSLEAELLPGDAAGNTRSGMDTPILKLLLHQNGETSEPVYLLPGQTGDLMGHTVMFGAVRRWAHVDVSDDPSLPFLLVACILGTAGLLVRFLCIRKEIVVRRCTRSGRTSLCVSGGAEKYPASFREELVGVIDEIQVAVGPHIDVVLWQGRAVRSGAKMHEEGMNDVC